MPPLPRRIALACIVALLATRAWAQAPSVVASIKPVESLAAAVMAGVGTPELLVPGNASPHTYAMRPSDARRLGEARLVVWIGPIYEAFLTRPLAALAGSAKILTLAETPGVRVLPLREGGSWESDAAHHDHTHDHAGVAGDGHLWLAPDNARTIVAAIADALAELDAAHADAYRANAIAEARRLTTLEDELRRRLAPVAGRPFVVFHDAYQYFERAFGLAAAGSIALSPEQPPGARRLVALRQRIAATGAKCIFAEPQFEPALARTLAAETGARPATLDPLGAALPEGPELYPRLMRGLADALVDCLGR